MLSRLSPDSSEAARPLFAPLAYQLIVSAVLDGTSPGSVFVDGPAAPRTALLCSSEGLFLAGASDNIAFNTALADWFARWMRAALEEEDDDDGIVLVAAEGEGWEETLPPLFPRPPLQVARRHYLCSQIPPSAEASATTEFPTYRVDRPLLQRTDLQIPDHISRWAVSNWGSLDALLEQGFGFCTVYRNQVVSWSLADCASGNRCEIGIRTAPEFRRQGLAAQTATAAVQHALTHGYASVGWHCDADNTGSRKTAERVGFVFGRDYLQHFCRFTADA